jgi:hypothetical protein
VLAGAGGEVQVNGKDVLDVVLVVPERIEDGIRSWLQDTLFVW